MHVDGTCQCGRITFEAEVDPDNVGICHCNDCQRLTGTAYRVTVTAKSENFRIISGGPKLYTKTADNGRRRLQYFCPECGSPIYTTGEDRDADEVGIRLGTINQRQTLRPRSQIWCSSALPWVEDISVLPGRSGD